MQENIKVAIDNKENKRRELKRTKRIRAVYIVTVIRLAQNQNDSIKLIGFSHCPKTKMCLNVFNQELLGAHLSFKILSVIKCNKKMSMTMHFRENFQP